MLFLIQDDGEGIDVEIVEMVNFIWGGFCGKLIKLFKVFGFGNVNYVGVGNMVEVIMVLLEVFVFVGQFVVVGMC